MSEEGRLDATPRGVNSRSLYPPGVGPLVATRVAAAVDQTVTTPRRILPSRRSSYPLLISSSE